MNIKIVINIKENENIIVIEGNIGIIISKGLLILLRI